MASLTSIRTVRHDSEIGRWEYARRAPHPLLSGLVLQYTGFRQERLSFRRRRELPRDRTSLIISFDSPVRVIDPRRPEIVNSIAGAFVTGWWDTFAITDLDHQWSGLQIDFSPVGAHRILQVPMETLDNQIVSLDRVFDKSTAHVLTNRLIEAEDWAARFDLLDNALMTRVQRGGAVHREVAWAWAQLHATGGQTDVSHLANELGWSRKRLTAQFRSVIGRTPKLLARIIRMERVLDDLNRAAPRIGWAALALRHGYYDQAHMIRDFRQFTGSSPTDYVRRVMAGGGGVSAD